MELRINVETADGDETYDISAATIIRAERHFEKDFLELVVPAPSVETLAWLAWKQAGANGNTRLPAFDDYIDTLVDIGIGDDEGGGTPPLDPIT